MHRICAEFSLAACPHLYLHNAERRRNDDRAKAVLAAEINVGAFIKPEIIFLVKADKMKVKTEMGQPFVHFRPVSTEKYIYEDGKLVKAQQ